MYVCVCLHLPLFLACVYCLFNCIFKKDSFVFYNISFFLKIVFMSKYHGLFFFFNLLIYLFWLCWVLISVRGPSPVAASGGFSLSRPLPSRSTGSRRAGPAIVAHGPSRSAACGILPDQGSNPCPLHWQADSQPLRHQGSPYNISVF